MAIDATFCTTIEPAFDATFFSAYKTTFQWADDAANWYTNWST